MHGALILLSTMQWWSQLENALAQGALVSIDPKRSRVHLLTLEAL